MSLNLHVTAVPSAGYFSDLIQGNRLAGIRMNGLLFPSCDLTKEISYIPANTNKNLLWFDAKGRQLRIVEAIAHKDHYELVLNHKIKGMRTPHPIIFKAGEDWATVERIENGNRLHLRADGFPKYRVNPGDSIHFRNKEIEVDGPLFTEDERTKLAHLVKAGWNQFYLSYVEQQNDVNEFREIVGRYAQVILKIESKRGLEYVARKYKRDWPFSSTRLACARGDLYVEVDKPHYIMAAQKLIIERDSEAIVGSRMLLSLFQNNVPACSDLCELEFLKNLGYKDFLLCDDLCKKGTALERAISTFRAFARDVK